MPWQPTASLATLRQRAQLLSATRAFFNGRGLLEVDTPALVRHAVTDPHLENIQVRMSGSNELFLHTSPEFHMKRLLAAGVPDIWQLGKVFRDGEAGRHHEPEFTLLEWYRHDFSLARLAEETCELLAMLATVAEGTGAPRIFTREPPMHWTYAGLFRETVGVDPLTARLTDIQACAREVLGSELGPELCRDLGDEASLWLDLMMSHVVSKRLAGTGIAVVTGYPAAQAALARLNPDDQRIAERFEIFCGGIEVANGYRELTDAAEQHTRFSEDRAFRARLGRRDVVPDQHLLAALESGLPDCAGVAVGFDRLVMVLLGLGTLQEALSFPT